MAEPTTAVFQFVLNHSIKYTVANNEITFVPENQDITITELSIFPQLDISVIEAMASYPDGNDVHVAEATASILNINAAATAMPAKSAPVVKNIKSTEPITKKVKEDEKAPVNEAVTNPGKTIEKLDVQVLTTQLSIQKQVQVTGNKFSVISKSEDIASFMNYIDSKKVKVFLNGKEFQPKQEMEFIKRIFPQIDITVHLKSLV